jgi:hypothetical protein
VMNDGHYLTNGGGRVKEEPFISVNNAPTLGGTRLSSIPPPSEEVINLCDSGDEASTILNKSPAAPFSFDPLALDDYPRAQLHAKDSSHYMAPDFLDYDRSYMALCIPKRKNNNPSIDFNVKKPLIVFEHIPVYDCDETVAPQRNYLMVCERPCISKYVSTKEHQEPLMTSNTLAVDIWRRGDMGMMLRNRLDICNHYEIDGDNLDVFQRDAQRCGIRPFYHEADGKVKMINEDGHYLFLCNGGDFNCILEDMDLKRIADDVCFNDKPGEVPQKNSRGNRGPSLLFATSMSLKRKVDGQFAEPVMVRGSKRYSPLYSKITKAIRAMAAHRMSESHEPFPKPFPDRAEMPLRQQQWG